MREMNTRRLSVRVPPSSSRPHPSRSHAFASSPPPSPHTRRPRTNTSPRQSHRHPHLATRARRTVVSRLFFCFRFPTIRRRDYSPIAPPHPFPPLRPPTTRTLARTTPFRVASTRLPLVDRARARELRAFSARARASPNRIHPNDRRRWRLARDRRAGPLARGTRRDDRARSDRRRRPST